MFTALNKIINYCLRFIVLNEIGGKIVAKKHNKKFCQKKVVGVFVVVIVG